MDSLLVVDGDRTCCFWTAGEACLEDAAGIFGSTVCLRGCDWDDALLFRRCVGAWLLCDVEGVASSWIAEGVGPPSLDRRSFSANFLAMKIGVPTGFSLHLRVCFLFWAGRCSRECCGSCRGSSGCDGCAVSSSRFCCWSVCSRGPASSASSLLLSVSCPPGGASIGVPAGLAVTDATKPGGPDWRSL